MSPTSRATTSNKTMQNIVLATVEFSLDKTEWMFVENNFPLISSV